MSDPSVPDSSVGASLVARLAAAVDAGMPRARDDLARLVALRSVANPAIEPESECRAAAALVADLFTEAGVDGVQAHPTPDGSLAVSENEQRNIPGFAERKAAETEEKEDA